MKKRIFTIILAALLVLSASACNDADDHISEDGSSPANSYAEAESELEDDENDQIVSDGTIICNGNDNTRMVYKINQNGELKLYIKDWNEKRVVSSLPFSDEAEIEKFLYKEKAIAVNSKLACLFMRDSNGITVIRLEKGSQNETVTHLDVSEEDTEISGNFVNENVGFVFTFKEVSDSHASGGWKVSSLFVTKDGGNTWRVIGVQSAVSISLREHVIFSAMASEKVGLISGNYFGADYNFCERTILTTDGGLNWVKVAGLPEINELQWAIATDFKQTDDAYILTVRYTVSEENGELGYAEYKLTDLNTWTRIK